MKERTELRGRKYNVIQDFSVSFGYHRSLKINFIRHMQ